MEKEFVPYEQALELKELNAYIECFGFYWFNGSSNIWVLETKEYEDEYSKTISAPTFSQAFRWFREKYKISGEISSDYYLEGKDNEWEYNIYQLGKEDDGYVGTIPIFKTPEDAELACLKKLIEIVKER